MAQKGKSLNPRNSLRAAEKRPQNQASPLLDLVHGAFHGCSQKKYIQCKKSNCFFSKWKKDSVTDTRVRQKPESVSRANVSGCKSYLTVALKPQLAITCLQEPPRSFLFHVAPEKDCTVQYMLHCPCAASKLGGSRTCTLYSGYKLRPTLCDPMDCCRPGSPVPGISQARIPEWVAIHFSGGSSQPRNRTWVSCIAGRFFTI